MNISNVKIFVADIGFDGRHDLIYHVSGDNERYHFNIYYSIDAFISIPNHNYVRDLSQECSFRPEFIKKLLLVDAGDLDWSECDADSIICLVNMAMEERRNQ